MPTHRIVRPLALAAALVVAGLGSSAALRAQAAATPGHDVTVVLAEHLPTRDARVLVVRAPSAPDEIVLSEEHPEPEALAAALRVLEHLRARGPAQDREVVGIYEYTLVRPIPEARRARWAAILTQLRAQPRTAHPVYGGSRSLVLPSASVEAEAPPSSED